MDSIGKLIKKIKARFLNKFSRKNTINIGRKLDYILGRATGSSRSIERSIQMLNQLERIGLPDNPETRKLLFEHLINAFNDPSNISRVQANGRIVKESLLMGPRGGVKIKSIWEGNN